MIDHTPYQILCEDGVNRYLYHVDNEGEEEYILSEELQPMLSFYRKEYGFSEEDIGGLRVRIISVEEAKKIVAGSEDDEDLRTTLYDCCFGCSYYPCIIASNNW